MARGWSIVHRSRLSLIVATFFVLTVQQPPERSETSDLVVESFAGLKPVYLLFVEATINGQPRPWSDGKRLVHHIRRLSRIVAASFVLTDHHQWTSKRLVYHVRRLSRIGAAFFMLNVRRKDLISPKTEVFKLLYSYPGPLLCTLRNTCFQRSVEVTSNFWVHEQLARALERREVALLRILRSHILYSTRASTSAFHHPGLKQARYDAPNTRSYSAGTLYGFCNGR